jgi:histidine triad (HIT) family protein
MDCIFCKIIAGQLPALKIYENSHFLSFLDVGPLADGHILLIPKRHYTYLHEMELDDLASLSRAMPRLGQALLKATGADGYNVLQNNGQSAGQVVQHVHFHLIPRFPDDGLGYRWNSKKYSPGKDQEIQQKIISELK